MELLVYAGAFQEELLTGEDRGVGAVVDARGGLPAGGTGRAEL